MKKLSIVVLGLIAVVGVSHAEYEDMVMSETVVMTQPVSTVSQAMNMADNTPVVMAGNVIQSLGNEMYLFRDGTGTLTVEIEDDDWKGQTVTDSETVRIYGKVEHGAPGILVEVDRVEKM